MFPWVHSILFKSVASTGSATGATKVAITMKPGEAKRNMNSEADETPLFSPLRHGRRIKARSRAAPRLQLGEHDLLDVIEGDKSHERQQQGKPGAKTPFLEFLSQRAATQPL